MQAKRWILVVAVVFILAIIATWIAPYLGWQNLINRFVLYHLRPVLGNNARLQSADLSLSSLTLHNLSFVDTTKGIEAEVSHLRLNLQIFNIVKYGFSLLNLVDEARFEGWKIKISPPTRQLPPTKEKPTPSLRTSIWEFPSKIASLKRLDFINGSAVYNWVTIESIYGWIDFKQRDSLKFDIAGACLNPNSNLRLQGGASFKEKDFLLNANLEDASIPTDLNLHPKLHLQKGLMNLKAVAEYSSQGLALAGEASLDKVNLDYDNKIELRSGNFNAEFGGHSIRFFGDGKINSQKIVWAGRLEGLKSPQIEFIFDSKDADLSKLLKNLAPQLEISGKGDLRFKLTGPAFSPALDFQAGSSEIEYAGMKFKQVKVVGKGGGKAIELNNFSLNSMGGKISGEGNLTFENERLKLNLKTFYSGKPDLEGLVSTKPKLPIDLLNLKVDIRGNIQNPQIVGEYDMDVSNVDKILKGQMDFSNRKLKISEASGYGDSLIAFIDFAHSTPIFSVDFRNPQKLLLSSKLSQVFGEYTDLQISADGSPKDFEVHLSADFPYSDLLVNSHIVSDSITRIDGGYDWTSADTIRDGGEFLLQLLKDTLRLDNFTLNDKLYAWGAYDIKNRSFLNLEARAEQFPLESFLKHTTWKRRSEFGGDLKAAISLTGKLDSLNAKFNLLISKGRVFNLDGYWTSVNGEIEHRVLHLAGCDFGNRERTLFHGNGSWNFSTGEIGFRSEQQNIDADLLINSLTGKGGNFSGKGSYSIDASGTLQRPQIQANFSFQQGKAFKVPFDSFTGACNLLSDDSLGLSLHIGELQLRKNNGYSARLEGAIPLEKGEIDLKFVADGKLLSILPELTQTIKQAKGTSHIEAEIGGTKNGIQFKNASATLDSGMLALRAVVDKIENLKLRATLDSNFIHIHRLSGEIDGVPFEITTIPEVTTTEGPLQPWIIGDTGLSLGIFTAETADEGLKINLPGIVKAGETVDLTVLGESEGEKAYVAGPESHPLVRAKLLMKDGVLDCPSFTKSAPGSKPSVISHFFDKVNWDLEIIPDRGVTYNRDMSGLVKTAVWKEISGLFSRAVIDLEIDRQSEGLKIRGSLGDTTFTITGRLTSSGGAIEVLDMDFKVQNLSAEFAPGEIRPVVEGFATTTQRDSLGREQTITLRVAEVDPITGQKNYRPLWGNFTFSLENEFGDSPEQVLSQLGYSLETLDQMVYEMPVKVADKAVFGLWMGKLEREIKNVLGVDYINIDPAVAQNLLEEQLLTPASADSTQVDWRTRYLRRSRFVVGKYITNDLFFSYSGRFESGESNLDQRYRLGMIHAWNLEYRLPTKGANLLMVFSYEYDNLELKSDKKFSIRYDFDF